MSRGVIRSRDSLRRNTNAILKSDKIFNLLYLVEKVAEPPTEVMEVNVLSGG